MGIVTPVDDDDDVLAYTQGMRRKLIDKATSNGANIPTDPDGAGVVLKALGDMDRVAMGRKRLKVDQNIGDAVAQGTAIIAHIFGKVSGKDNPFVVKGEVPDRHLPEHPSDMAPGLTLVPGELDQVAHELTYDGLMSGEEEKKK